MAKINNIADILKNKDLKSNFRNKHEFQAYGNRLAEELGEPNRRGMYIKLAQTVDRNILEVAKEFVMRSENATTKGKLFMWKVGQLKKALKEKEKEGAEKKETLSTTQDA